MSSAIARQLHTSSVDVLESLHVGDWRIIRIDTDQADEVFLFYSHSPLTSRYVTMWGGAARKAEQ